MKRSASSPDMSGNMGSPYIADRKLIPRIKQYIDSCGSKPVVLSSMVDNLQQTYNDYKRKKRQAFAKSVEKAYSSIKGECAPQDELEALENHHLAKRQKKHDNQEGDSSDSDAVDQEYQQQLKSTNNVNSMNNSMRNLYSRGTPNRQGDGTPLGWVIDKTPSNVSDSANKSSKKNRDGDKNTNSNKKDKGAESVQKEDFDGTLRKFDSSDVAMKEDDRENVKEVVGRLFEDSDNLQSGVSTPVRNTEGKMPSVKSSKKVKRRKESTKEPEITKSSITFADVGGQESTLKEICKLLIHMRHPEVYTQLGVTPPKGFLLHGPPGCGKTLLANAIAGELELPFIKIAATELVSGVSGESEEKIRELFERAMSCAPCILFLDEIDAITPKRETASKDMERRIVSQLLTCMDDLNTKANTHVLVIGATNRPDSLDPALRRAGRFDREISLGIPDEKARQGILTVLCKSLRLEEQFDFVYLAKATPGFVGADLTALAREAAITAVNRVFDGLQLKLDDVPTKTADSTTTPNSMQTDVAENETQSTDGTGEKPEEKPVVRTEMDSLILWLKEKPPLSEDQLQSLCISMADFESALKHVQPSAKREGFATIPDVTWDDIGALADVREELEMAILAPVRQKETFQALGLKNPPGILLAGPPGCGKTLLAKAIANESGINFISVKGPELLNMYVGESERAVRQVFLRARNSAPCVIFFDELDSICPKRSASADGGSSTRVVNQLLTEMDGLEERKQVFIMGATNRPDIIDPAILRPGRLDKILYVGLPSPTDREDILKTITKNGTTPLLTEDVNLHDIANDERTQGLTGADLAALVRESSMAALRQYMNSPQTDGSIAVNKSHFEAAFGKVRSSVSKSDRVRYEKMKNPTAQS